MDSIAKIIKEEFSLKDYQVVSTIALIDEGNTIPFIARYRKEKTGELDDQILRELSERLTYLRNLEQKRSEVMRLIDEQGALTEEICGLLESAKTLREIEDIYRPLRPKRRTRATIAKEKGLLPLAEAMLLQNMGLDLFLAEAQNYIDSEKGVESVDEAIEGAMDIVAETVSDNADIRKKIRDITMESGIVTSKAAREEDSVYSPYYDFSEPVIKIANHRLLAINRGEKDGFLKVSLSVDEDRIFRYLDDTTIKSPSSGTAEYVRLSAQDAYRRLIAPSVENEVRTDITESAQESAIKLFGVNLHNLLLQPPIRDKVVLGLDPAYRTGCKIAVTDGTGKVLAKSVIYCTLEHHDKKKAKDEMLKLIENYGVDIIAIGNGTATKESEIFVSDVISNSLRSVKYAIVNESGASVYSASKLGAEEFPDYDVALRSAVSIARRLQDPLAELVKIDPKSIGVGQYQHDMNQKRLSEALGAVVEDCVNSVGVELSTASASLLSYVAGVNMAIAKNIVTYREENGRFKNRKQLLKVPKLGAKAFLQCAGFLRIADSDEPLDNTSVHPESYEQTRVLIEKMGYTAEEAAKDPRGFKEKVSMYSLDKLSKETGLGIPTLRDAVEAVSRPGRDPRDELREPVLLSELLSIENLKEGMILTGTVRNVIDFGAFVDIGVHQDGLVHVSHISNKFLKHPTEALSVGDVVKVKIIGLDIQKKRISLSIKEALGL